MAEVGLREMRQNASELVRRAESGERLTVTVSGRPAAILGPLTPASWRDWDDIAAIFRGRVNPEFEVDLRRVDGSLIDPWAKH
jgi:prevent-host-death family protein